MNDKNLSDYDGIQLDLAMVVKALWRRIGWVLLAAMLGLGAAMAVTATQNAPQYQSSVTFYVKNNDTAASITSGDLVTARGLVDSYLVILTTRESLNEIIAYAGADRTVEELQEMVTAEDVNGTEFFQVTVTCPAPEEARALADAIAAILPGRISGIIEGTYAKVVDPPQTARQPTAPGYGKAAATGFAAGLALAVGGILLGLVFDPTVRRETDACALSGLPVLAAVPQGQRADPELRLPSEAAEAYKLLRFRLECAFPPEKGCPIVAVTSAMTGEEKSRTAENFACILSQGGRRVLLIDGDLRPKKRDAGSPGLSDYLTRKCSAEELCRPEGAFFRISAGHGMGEGWPDSTRMAALLGGLRTRYDVILLDLAPVGEAGDALTVAREADTFLLVVREGVCKREKLTEAARRLETAGGSVLGLVYIRNDGKSRKRSKAGDGRRGRYLK